MPEPVDYAIEVANGHLFRPVMVRLADEGVPVRAIARSFRVPFAAVNETIAAALQAARLLACPPIDWPPTQPAHQRYGRAVRYSEGELITALQHRYNITRQQALLLIVMLKRELATKEMLHAAAQLVHGPGQETSRKLVDVLICKLRKRMAKHGFTIQTIWGGGYFLAENDRKAILQAVGRHPGPLKVPVPKRRR
ncbi:MAG: helix-turn-helix domain-containing protein [Rhizobiales bacterium]|nr:helix-turn-helix domain-containing protein [Hyphomicrobiales bacterium]